MRASSFIMDWRSGPSGSRGSIWRTILAAVKSALDQFRDHHFAGDQVGHGDERDFDHAAGNLIGERRNPVDHYKGIADECRFDGGGSAGHDGGARMQQGGAGIVDQSDGEAVAVML